MFWTITVGCILCTWAFLRLAGNECARLHNQQRPTQATAAPPAAPAVHK